MALDEEAVLELAEQEQKAWYDELMINHAYFEKHETELARTYGWDKWIAIRYQVVIDSDDDQLELARRNMSHTMAPHIIYINSINNNRENNPIPDPRELEQRVRGMPKKKDPVVKAMLVLGGLLFGTGVAGFFTGYNHASTFENQNSVPVIAHQAKNIITVEQRDGDQYVLVKQEDGTYKLKEEK